MDKILVSIAGFDPSGGAGVLLDVSVFRRFGFFGAGLLTSVTAQNSRSVEAVRCLGGRFLWRQYETLVRDVKLSGIKIGMLGGSGILATLGRILADHPGLPIVVDPVFRSSSGRWLLEKKSVSSFLDRIRGKITLLTPNLFEASLISGITLSGPGNMKEAARKIVDLLAAACLIKGGHLAGQAVDVLYDGRRFTLFPHKKIPMEVHGTGCFLSSSLLCYLVMKKPMVEACSLAIQFTREAMKKAVRRGKRRAAFAKY